MSILDKVILGINDTHDAAAALIKGGKVLCAVAEERIQRVKSVGGFPKGAIEACLRYAGLDYDDIDLVAVAGTRAVPVNLLGTMSTHSTEDFYRLQEKKRYPQFYEGRTVPYSEVFPDYRPKGNVHYPLDRIPLKESREMTPAEKRAVAEIRLEFIAETCGVPRTHVHTLDHHTCHAYYAYYASPLRGFPVTVLTLDAGGDGIYDSINLFDELGRFNRLHASHDCIIGPLYTMVTLLLGMRPYEHEYKVMGLAPYAKEHVKRRTRELLLEFMNLNGFRFSRNPEMKDLFWHTKDLLKHERFDGIAGGLQDFAEFFLTAWTQSAIAATRAPKVAYAGGVALNVKANKLIAELEGLEGLYVPPGPGDESLSIGAVWALMDRLNPAGDHRERIEPLANAYIGPDFNNGEIDEFRAHPAVAGRFREVSADPELLVAQALQDQRIVGVCRGRMEFGPRSLGHRSLLANPSQREAVRQINEAIKGRDFWMPFAPSILEEYLPEYVHDNGRMDLSYMTVCLDSTPEGQVRMPAALHPYDMTVRVQSVGQSQTPAYHSLLSRFRELTGLGGVLNTSLNIHGKPIVMRPIDVAEELLSQENVAIDDILVGNRFFTRSR